MAAESSSWRSAGRSATNARAKHLGSDREHGAYRLDAKRIAILEDVTRGIEEGEAGLKSISEGAANAAASGASASEIALQHHRDLQIIEDEDECFNAIGDMLFAGFSFAEVAQRVRLSGGATKMLALERWCARAGIRCNPDVTPAAWRGSNVHEDRRRARRAIAHLRQTHEGTQHAAVLYVVYGHPDPTLAWVERFDRDVDTAPAGHTPKLDAADRETYKLGTLLLDKLGRELAPLARYTDAVEAKRQALVTDLARHRAQHAWADRMISSGDALRAACAPFREPKPVQGSGEPKVHWMRRCEERNERKRAHEDARASFLTAAKLDANRMLTDASLAFDAAWRASWRE
jgi:hypothetical protein